MQITLGIYDTDMGLKVAKVVEAMEAAEDCDFLYSVDNTTDNLKNLSSGLKMLAEIGESLNKAIAACENYLERIPERPPE